jgi:hypothetical protein
LFSEIFRVLKAGGRAVISDIVSDEPVPGHLQNDPKLWSGCVSGALTEQGFLEAFGDAGFYGMQILSRDGKPWATVDGIEFRAVTISAHKAKEGACLERNQAVIYLGPFKEVVDDDNHRFERGRRHAVCDGTYQLCKREPYNTFFAFVDPITPLSAEEAGTFECSATRERDPRETKGQDYRMTVQAQPCCDRGECS